MKINELFSRHFGTAKGIEQIPGLADYMDRCLQEQSREPIHNPAMAEALERRMLERQAALDGLKARYLARVSESYAP